MLLADDQGESVKIKPLEEWTAYEVTRLAGPALERLIDLIVAYDRSGALGGRDWLLENADPPQLEAALSGHARQRVPFSRQPGGPGRDGHGPGGRRVEPAEFYEWALAAWHLDPDELRARLDPEQLTVLWNAGQARIARESRDRLVELYVGVRDGQRGQRGLARPGQVEGRHRRRRATCARISARSRVQRSPADPRPGARRARRHVPRHGPEG